MHYKNGRLAHNGDKVVWVTKQYGGPLQMGVLYDAVVGEDYCNGHLAPIAAHDPLPNLSECLHLDDFLAAFPESVPDTSVISQ